MTPKDFCGASPRWVHKGSHVSFAENEANLEPKLRICDTLSPTGPNHSLRYAVEEQAF